ncbi:unnamed protein product [Ilex paraguariensis]|uniref:Uncharacterized protein n=1 Tax=Ilex paraguariensis TaxID=185542 RepID=A0ABC8ULJ1_9AQUA
MLAELYKCRRENLVVLAFDCMSQTCSVSSQGKLHMKPTFGNKWSPFGPLMLDRPFSGLEGRGFGGSMRRFAISIGLMALSMVSFVVPDDNADFDKSKS